MMFSNTKLIYNQEVIARLSCVNELPCVIKYAIVPLPYSYIYRGLVASQYLQP